MAATTAPGLMGVDDARRAVSRFVSEYRDTDLKLLLLSGPPGSGKTSLSEEALASGDYVVYRASSEQSTVRECATIKKFCRAAHSVDAMLSGKRARRRAVFLDDALSDAKSISTVYDALKKEGCAALVVACIGRSVKAPEVRRRAALVVPVAYPSKRATAAHLRRVFGDEISKEAVKRCVAAADGCIPKAVQFARGELYGTTAKESHRGVDTTIFDDVGRGFSLATSGHRFKDVEVAVSSEPSMSAMILRESLARPCAETRRAFRQLSKIAPGSSMAATMSTVVFMETCLREREPLNQATLKFPRCYTTTSSRTSNVRKRLAADVTKTGTCAGGRRS